MSQTQNNDNSNSEQSIVHEPEIINPEDNSWPRGRNFRNSANNLSGQTWFYSPMDMSGCASPFITLFLFLIMLGQYGLLAAIGFLVFYTCGAIIGSLRITRGLVLGVLINPWPWRIGNWIISFLLTIWLAGGFSPIQ